MITIIGCKKENFSDNIDLVNEPENKRLIISSQQFKAEYKMLRKLPKSQIIKNGSKNINSLIEFESSKKSEEISNTIGTYINSILNMQNNPLNGFGDRSNGLKSSRLAVTGNTQVLIDSNQLYTAVLSELVEDDALKSLINEQGEIQVDNNIYKITPFGTFFTEIKNEHNLDKAYAKMASQNNITIRLVNPSASLNLKDLTTGSVEKKSLMKLSNNVYFIDTFNESPTQQLIQPIDPIDGGGGGYLPPSVNTDPYGDMLSTEIEFKSGVGSIWNTVFTNSTKYNYFNDNYRISVLFYDRNYAILKSLGLKVKLQKDGWLWWNKTDAQEIRAGWERIVYKQTNAIPQISRPTQEIPTILNPYTINPNEVPVNGAWLSSKYASLYSWKLVTGDNELFTIVLPEFLFPPSSNDVTVSSSDLKPLVITAWNKLKATLTRSVPMSASGDPNNFKFPVYDIRDGGVKYLSINDMEKIPKALNSAPAIYQQISAGQKIRTYIGPYEKVVYNTDIIDIPLEFSTATISLSQNLNSPLSISNTFNSLGLSGLDNSYDVEMADVFGSVKYNGRWLGIRIRVNITK